MKHVHFEFSKIFIQIRIIFHQSLYDELGLFTPCTYCMQFSGCMQERLTAIILHTNFEWMMVASSLLSKNQNNQMKKMFVHDDLIHGELWIIRLWIIETTDS